MATTRRTRTKKQPQKPPHAWVVEMFNPELIRWEPCGDAAIMRVDVASKLADWRHDNPDDRFRCSRYVRVRS